MPCESTPFPAASASIAAAPTFRPIPPQPSRWSCRIVGGSDDDVHHPTRPEGGCSQGPVHEKQRSARQGEEEGEGCGGGRSSGAPKPKRNPRLVLLGQSQPWPSLLKVPYYYATQQLGLTGTHQSHTPSPLAIECHSPLTSKSTTSSWTRRCLSGRGCRLWSSCSSVPGHCLPECLNKARRMKMRRRL